MAKEKPGGHKGAAFIAPTDTSCKYTGCRKTVAKFSFCAEHFNWFKFGLINKSGEHVPDFDKKFDHFIRQKPRQEAGKETA